MATPKLQYVAPTGDIDDEPFAPEPVEIFGLPEGGGSVAWGDVTGKPSTFAPEAHTHAIADVTGLQSALDGKQASGDYAAEEHTHAIADVTGLQSALDGKQASGDYAAEEHTHAIADVTGLQSALDGKQASGSYAAASHTHDVADVSGLQAIIDDLTDRIEALEA